MSEVVKKFFTSINVEELQYDKLSNFSPEVQKLVVSLHFLLRVLGLIGKVLLLYTVVSKLPNMSSVLDV